MILRPYTKFFSSKKKDSNLNENQRRTKNKGNAAKTALNAGAALAGASYLLDAGKLTGELISNKYNKNLDKAKDRAINVENRELDLLKKVSPEVKEEAEKVMDKVKSMKDMSKGNINFDGSSNAKIKEAVGKRANQKIDEFIEKHKIHPNNLTGEHIKNYRRRVVKTLNNKTAKMQKIVDYAPIAVPVAIGTVGGLGIYAGLKLKKNKNKKK